jgi:hypothetical protein
MSSLPPSRRQLLGGLLACLCGLFSGRKAKAAGPAQPPPSTSTFCDGRPFGATAFYDKLGTVTSFTYDGGGRLPRVQDRPPTCSE